MTADIPAAKAALAHLDLIDAETPVRAASRDFFWYSPVLKARLDHVTADFVVRPRTEAEVIEAEVLSTSPISGSLIREIDFPEGVLVGAVRKGEKVVKPTGSLRIDEGDQIVIFALAGDVPEVERLLQVSIDFF